MARLPQVTIQVVPQTVGVHCGVAGGFIIAERNGAAYAAFVSGQPYGRTALRDRDHRCPRRPVPGQGPRGQAQSRFRLSIRGRFSQHPPGRTRGGSAQGRGEHLDSILSEPANRAWPRSL
ncbi:hypothetical protein ACWEN6_14775 [Sphaerisporangium sp. NPDC004334]